MDREIVESLLIRYQDLLSGLQSVYGEIPDTNCNRRAYCCSLLPETSFLEFLRLYKAVKQMDRVQMQSVVLKTVAYYLLNAVERTNCPFLEERDCLIYPVRPFTCRAYGLWSRSCYDNQTESNRKAKVSVIAGWKALGINLPEEILSFRQKYCLNVRVCDGRSVDDTALNGIWNKIITLDEKLTPYNSIYIEQYFSDFSFTLAGLYLGYRRALMEKVTIAREVVNCGTKARLKALLGEIL